MQLKQLGGDDPHHRAVRPRPDGARTRCSPRCAGSATSTRPTSTSAAARRARCKELVGAPCQNGCPVGHRGVALRGPRRPRRVRGRLPGHPRGQPVPVGLRPRLPPSVRGVVPRRRHAAASRSPSGRLKRFVVDHVDPRRLQGRSSSPPGRTRRASRSSAPARPASPPRTTCRCWATRSPCSSARPKPGGMLVGAIPAYRLPRERLAARRSSACSTTTSSSGTTRPWAATSRSTACMAEGYKAVYLAIGSHQSKKLGPARRGRPGRHPRHRSSSRPTTCTARTWPRAASASSAAATRPWTPRAWPSASRASRASPSSTAAPATRCRRTPRRSRRPRRRRQARAAGRPGRGPRQGRQAHRRPVHPQPAGRAGRLRAPQAGADPGLRVRRRARHADRGHQRAAGDGGLLRA